METENLTKPQLQQHQYNKKIEAILNNSTKEQFFIIEKWSRIIGRVLSNVEISISEGKQYKILKRLLNDIMYGARNSLLPILTEDVENKVAIEKIREEANKMLESLDTKIEMTFPQINQQKAIKSSIHEEVERILDEIFAFFEYK